MTGDTAVAPLRRHLSNIMHWPPAPLVLLSVLFGCADPVDCTEVEVPPLAVLPIDGATGSPVADSTVVTATQNGQVWTFVPYKSNAAGQVVGLWGGSGRGAYHLRAVHPRFLSWDSTVVTTAVGDGCNGFPEEMTIRLARL